jgi:NADP-reducing hydrogenase subunit HndB
MKKIQTLSELQKKRDNLKALLDAEHDPKHSNAMPRITIAMATCGIASGAKEIYEFFNSELKKRNINATVVQAGCMGYCYAEPTVEVKMPGKEAIVFGFVDTNRADEIIEKYIKANEVPEGVIPKNYQTI